MSREQEDEYRVLLDADHDILSFCAALDRASSPGLSITSALDALSRRSDGALSQVNQMAERLEELSPRSSVQLEPVRRSEAAFRHMCALMEENKRLRAENNRMEAARVEAADEIQLLEVDLVVLASRFADLALTSERLHTQVLELQQENRALRSSATHGPNQGTERLAQVLRDKRTAEVSLRGLLSHYDKFQARNSAASAALGRAALALAVSVQQALAEGQQGGAVAHEATGSGASRRQARGPSGAEIELAQVMSRSGQVEEELARAAQELASHQAAKPAAAKRKKKPKKPSEPAAVPLPTPRASTGLEDKANSSLQPGPAASSAAWATVAAGKASNPPPPESAELSDWLKGRIATAQVEQVSAERSGSPSIRRGGVQLPAPLHSEGDSRARSARKNRARANSSAVQEPEVLAASRRSCSAIKGGRKEGGVALAAPRSIESSTVELSGELLPAEYMQGPQRLVCAVTIRLAGSYGYRGSRAGISVWDGDNGLCLVLTLTTTEAQIPLRGQMLVFLPSVLPGLIASIHRCSGNQGLQACSFTFGNKKSMFNVDHNKASTTFSRVEHGASRSGAFIAIPRPSWSSFKEAMETVVSSSNLCTDS